MTRTQNYFIGPERTSWLEDAIRFMRDAVLERRATTARTMPEAIDQTALDIDLPSSRVKSLFYREVLFVTAEQRAVYKAKEVQEADARIKRLLERTDRAREQRRQRVLELKICANSGHRSANGDGIGA